MQQGSCHSGAAVVLQRLVESPAFELELELEARPIADLQNEHRRERERLLTDFSVFMLE